jgi:hypothetical protein
MGKPKGSKSVRKRLLDVAKSTEDLLRRLDEQLQGKNVLDVAMLTERRMIANLVMRTLREAQRLKHSH